MRAPRLLLLLALAAAGCTERPPAPPEAAPPLTAPPAPTATIRVADQAGRAGPVRLADVAHLVAQGSYAGEPGAHAVRVDVTAPNGNVYTQLRGDLQAGADGRAVTASRLEVRGTPIDAYHMTGAWKFVLVVDGTPLASAAVDVTE